MRPSHRLAEGVLELALFQVAWWIAVLGAASGRPWAGPVAIAGYLGLRLLRTSPAQRFRLLAAAAVLAAGGFAVDSFHAAAGLLDFVPPASRFAPLWIVALWAQLAGAAPALAKLAERPLLAASLGAVGGPLAYAAGERVGAVTLAPDPIAPIASLVLVWTLTLPLVARLARWSLASSAARGNDSTASEVAP